MPLIIPPAANYSGDLQSMPSFAQDEPREGRRQIPVEITWNNMGGPNKNVSLSLKGNSVREWTQISTIKVDNSACGADVLLMFTDTTETISIPAGEALAVVPVYSNSLEFFVYCPRATAEDITRLIILNYADDPAEIASTGAAGIAAGGNMNCTNAITNLQLVAPGINGTLTALSWFYTQVFGFPNVQPNTSQGAFKLADGAGTIFIPGMLVAAYFSSTPNQYSIPLLNLTLLNIRFRNGLIVTFTPVSNWGTGNLMLNAFCTYKQP